MKHFDKTDVRERFNQQLWHDSKLIDSRLITVAKDGEVALTLAVDLLTDGEIGKQKWSRRVLAFDRCRWVQMETDVLGMQMVGGDISDAVCEEELAARKLLGDKFSQFDLPQPNDPFEDIFLFRLVLIPPGGEISVLAKSFHWG